MTKHQEKNYSHRQKSFQFRFYSFLSGIVLCWTITFYHALLTVSQVNLIDNDYNYKNSIMHMGNSISSITSSDEKSKDRERVQKLAIKMLADAEDHRVRKIALEIARIEDVSKLKEEQDLIDQNTEDENNNLYYQLLNDEDVEKEIGGEERKFTHIEYKENFQVDDQYYSYYEDDDTKDSVVVGMGFNLPKIVYQRFVGSLRNSGFVGNIIIGVGPRISKEAVDYLKSQNVTIKTMRVVKCTYKSKIPKNICFHPHHDVKRDWSRFAHARDWLLNCTECKGPVLFTDIHDTFFQKNPFSTGMHVIDRLLLFEEHPHNYGIETYVGKLIKECAEIEMGNSYPLLSIGCAIAQVDQMINFLNIMHVVMTEWMQYPECHFTYSSKADDKAILNYLRLSGNLPPKSRIVPHRTGLFNAVGFEGSSIYGSKMHLWLHRGVSKDKAMYMPYDGANGRTWIDTDLSLTDDDGFFINLNFDRSSIIYEYSSFGLSFLSWLDNFVATNSSDYDNEYPDTVT